MPAHTPTGLGLQDAMATIAVRDLDAARTFYSDVLGLALLESTEPCVLNYRSGNTPVVVYVSAFAGTNRATSATWAVGERFDGLMDALRAQGVAFEHYDLPGLERQGDVHVAGDFKGAWFKDPDGNILHILNR